MQLKAPYGLKYGLFGGAQGFDNWFDTCAHRSCPAEVHFIPFCLCFYFILLFLWVGLIVPIVGG